MPSVERAVVRAEPTDDDDLRSRNHQGQFAEAKQTRRVRRDAAHLYGATELIS